MKRLNIIVLVTITMTLYGQQEYSLSLMKGKLEKDLKLHYTDNFAIITVSDSLFSKDRYFNSYINLFEKNLKVILPRVCEDNLPFRVYYNNKINYADVNVFFFKIDTNLKDGFRKLVQEKPIGYLQTKSFLSYKLFYYNDIFIIMLTNRFIESDIFKEITIFIENCI